MISPECVWYVRPAYILYGSLSVIITMLAIGYAIASYSQFLFHLTGRPIGIAILVLFLAGIVGRFAWQLQRWAKEYL